MKNQKFYSMFMILMLSVTTFFQPMVALGETLDPSNDGAVQEIQLDDADAVIEVDEAVQQEVEKESKAVSDEKDVKQAVDEPVKNKGDPVPAVEEDFDLIEEIEVSSLMMKTVPKNTNSVLDYSKTEVPNKDSVASSKYAVIASFTDKTELVLNGGKVKTNAEGYPTWVEPSNSDKGKISVRYTNVGSYKGKSLDFILTVKDWKKAGYKGGEYFTFRSNAIGFYQAGYDSVSLDGTYLYSDTGKEAKDLTGSYMSISDLDVLQSVSFDKDMMNKIETVYASKDSWVNVWEKDGNTHFGEVNNMLSERTDRFAMITILVEGHTLNFNWNKDWSLVDTKATKVIDWYNAESQQFFAYENQKPVRTETLDPTKKVSDSDEKQVDSNNLSNYNEKFTYDIYHTVPAEYEEFFYNSYVMEDKILDELKIESAKVFNGANKDVTNLFDVNLGKDNKVTFTAKKGTLSNASFYGEDYRYEIKVSIKEGADLSKFEDKSGKVTLENVAKVTIDGKGKVTNKTKTTPPVPTLPNTPLVKDVEGKQHLDVKHEKNYKYNVKTKIATHLGGYKKILIKDTLDKRLDVVGAKVLVDGKVSDFEVKVKDQTVSVKFDRKQLDTIKGKEVNLQITAKIKSGTDIELIDNKATIQLNDNPEIDSNVVTVTPPKPITPEVVKDVEEQEHLEVEHEKEYNYNVKTNVPAELGGYKDLTLVDTLDKRLDVLGAKVLIDGKETEFKADVKDQTVSVKFDRKQLETIKGKEVNLQITAKIQTGTDIELIDNKATIQLNDTPEVDSNVVTVVPPAPETPELVKDVEGKEHLEVNHEKEYNYNVKTIVANELGGYESLTLSDELDSRLDIVGAKVLVDGDVVEYDVSIEGQLVKLELSREQLNTISGKELNLQITAKIQSGTNIELIDNKATIQLNDNPEVDSNVVTVIPPTPETPEIVKDVEGKEHLEIETGKTYDYNVKTQVPTELGGYETLTLTDKLDSRLDVIGAKVLVDGETSDFKAEINDQIVSLELTREQLDTIAGQEVTIQISAKIKDGVKVELIENVATIQLNDTPEVDSNVVTVIPPKPLVEKPVEVKKIPQTGSAINYGLIGAGVLLLVLGGYFIYRRKKSVQ